MYQWIKAIVLLPGNALIVIPAILLYFTNYSYAYPHTVQIIIGMIFLLLGLFLAIWTMYLFEVVGKGTAAPWHPPQKLVVKGPYRHVRNPMLTSVLIMILAETLLLHSYVLLIYFFAFLVINTIYFYFFEEKSLEKRFGEDYVMYKQNVSRWIPKIKPYNQNLNS